MAAGRRSGKTEIARRRIVRWLNVTKPWPDPLYFFALPTRDQAKRVAWPKFKALVPKYWVASISESELSIETIYGSKLYVLGLDKPERAEGVGWDGGVVDECFIAGTMVDTINGPRPIESIRVGDRVPCAMGIGTVTATKVRHKAAVVVVKSERYSLTCSLNHPFLTKRGWVPAGQLRPGDIHVDNLQDVSPRVLLQTGESPANVLQLFVQGQRPRHEGVAVMEGQRTNRSGRRKAGSGGEGRYGLPSQSKCASEDQHDAAGDRSSTVCTRRQGARHDKAAGNASTEIRRSVCCGVGREDRLEASIAYLVSDRYSQRGVDGRNRSGWTESQFAGRSGSSAGRIPRGVRVDSVEIYESGSDEFARISGGEDTVALYDLTVDLHPSFRVHGLIVHNSCDQKPGVFDKSLRPALSDRQGWCDRIGVPKRTGPGAHEFKLFFELGLSGEDPEVESFTWPSADILPAKEIESAKRQLSDKDFNEQYNASWESVGGAVFYAFSEIHNVRDNLTYHPDLPLLIGCDFNVDPMAWAIAQQVNGELHIFDEMFIRNTNTEATLRELANRYGTHKAGVNFFGDATGKARKTAASQSDYIQIRNFKGIENARVMFPEANPPRHDRFASCNAMFLNAAGERRCFVHPRCKNLIRDLVVRAYTAGTSEPDDHDDISHASDAAGYLIHWLFPLRIVGNQAPPSIPALR